MSEQNKPLSDMAADLTLFPQKLWNIVMPERKNVLADAEVRALIGDAETRLAGSGRINVRMSGTEPKLRIMIEAEDEGLMLDIGEPLTEAIRVRCESV
jgi:phosphoglucosamine mutase